VHFITNSGPSSDARRHHVEVLLLEHSAMVASPQEPSRAAGLSVKGALKFDCDCGRHRFWYRYIATIGHFNAGRDETGYPKIRNPKLRGVACKHVLRVMKHLGSAQVLHFITRMIEADRRALDGSRGRTVSTSPSQAEAIAAKQLREGSHPQNRIAKQKAPPGLARAIRDKVSARPKPDGERAKRDIQLRLKSLVQLGAITEAQHAAALAALDLQGRA
jgi:hypothetical protein